MMKYFLSLLLFMTTLTQAKEIRNYDEALLEFQTATPIKNLSNLARQNKSREMKCFGSYREDIAYGAMIAKLFLGINASGGEVAFLGDEDESSLIKISDEVIFQYIVPHLKPILYDSVEERHVVIDTRSIGIIKNNAESDYRLRIEENQGRWEMHLKQYNQKIALKLMLDRYPKDTQVCFEK